MITLRLSAVACLLMSCVIGTRRARAQTLTTIKAIETTSTGMQTTISQERPTSWRSAMMMPPTHMIGAAIIIVHVIRTSIWTC